jgi:hypothetical protein
MVLTDEDGMATALSLIIILGVIRGYGSIGILLTDCVGSVLG